MRHSNHRALARLQKCECCKANVDIRGDCVSRWTGHTNIFFHRHCYEDMMKGETKILPRVNTMQVYLTRVDDGN